MTEQELNKACAWLEEKAELYAELDYYDDWANSADEDVCKPCVRFDTDKFLADFRKAMTTKTNTLFEQCLSNVNPDTRAEVRGNMGAVVKESLTTELTWHKASDELPPYDKVVIVAYDGYTEDCCFNHRSNDPEVKTSENGWCDVGYDTEPTHWMYIPEIKED